MQRAAETSRFRALQDKVRSELEASGIPGVAVGIVSGDDTYVGGFGVTNIDEPMPVTADTLFRVASITKTVTGTAVMRLVDQGRLDIDAPVRRYIPDLTLDSPEAAEQLTVRHLITHTAGWGTAGGAKLVHSEEALERLVAGLSGVPRLLPVGEAWSYGAIGLAVAGRIIEIVSGKVFETAVRELVLDPIGMDHSVFFAEDTLSFRTAAPHVLSGEAAALMHQRGVRGFPTPNPGAGLFSTVRDLVAFAKFHLGDGTTAAGERLMSRESLERMRAPHEPSGAIGVTWFREQSGRPGVVGHTGAIAGFLSELIVAPEHQFAFVVLTNASPPLDGLFIFRIMSILNSGGPLGLVDWAAREYAGIEEPAEPELMLAPRELAVFAGHYSGWCELEVEADGRRLLLRFGAVGQVLPPPASAALYAGDRIRLLDGPGKGMRGQFIRGSDGTVRHLRLPVLVLRRRAN